MHMFIQVSGPLVVYAFSNRSVAQAVVPMEYLVIAIIILKYPLGARYKIFPLGEG